MPYKNPEKQREANRKAQERRRRAVTPEAPVTPAKATGMTDGMTENPRASDPASPPETGPLTALRAYLAVPADPTARTAQARMSGLERMLAITKGLDGARLGMHVRFGFEGPTLDDIGDALRS